MEHEKLSHQFEEELKDKEELLRINDQLNKIKKPRH